MKEYRNHNCNKLHRKTEALAKCMFPKGRVGGFGEYASVSWCWRRKGHSVALYATEEEALSGKARIDAHRCGGVCRGSNYHEVVKLILPEVC